MSYSSNADILNEFSPEELARLTGDESGGNIDYTRIDDARDLAESIIDSYLNGRYTLPLPIPIDPIIKKISVDLTIYFLYENERKNSIIPEIIMQRRHYAMSIIVKIAKGIMVLAGYSSTFSAPPSIISNLTGERVISRENLDEFIIQ